MAIPVAPLGTHSLLIFLLQVGILLAAAVALGRLAVRAGMPSLVGELTAGVVLGPSILGAAVPDLSRWMFPAQSEQLHLLDAVGQLGVLLLVGLTGMHLDLGQLRRGGGVAARVSIGGLVVPLALGVGLGLLLPSSVLPAGTDRPVFALFLAVAMCVSAIPVIAKTLWEMRLLHRDIGHLIMSAAIVDDVVGWLLLSVVAAMAAGSLGGLDVALAVGTVVLVVVVARWLARPLVGALLRRVRAGGEPGPTVASVVVILLLFAAATHALHLEPVFGAFVGGLVINGCASLDRAALAPLRLVVMSVLAPLFFATVGLRSDLTALARPAVLGVALLVLAVAVVGKFVGAYVGARAARLGHWEGLALGAGLNARGVIEIIVATVGLRLGILDTAMFTVIVLVAIVTSVMAPPGLRYAAARLPASAREHRRAEALS
ncbi:cation:proton antiporter [Micromonospora sp. DT227]|uniref:cation:proton antiporter n=1 Tax=Micromonospora sp. DT227 TaxID=3393433 RepID=UPI003CEB06D8